MKFFCYVVLFLNVLVDVLLVTAPDALFLPAGIGLWVFSFLATIACILFVWKKDKRLVIGLFITVIPLLYNIIMPFIAGVFGFPVI